MKASEEFFIIKKKKEWCFRGVGKLRGWDWGLLSLGSLRNIQFGVSH